MVRMTLREVFLGWSKGTSELRDGEFWSLDDVSFELKRGECLGVIGPNGAGKSTLLKILNGILAPDRGRVEISRRIGALIEVGAGFHPQLSGRENIFINGAILGFSKQEIRRKFDDIVEFADIGDFLDSPVKHYSSGMYVRLGFAIAAQMEPDVILIDEVLAVGDAGFRSKCYNFIGSLAKRSAVVFVSHAMPAVSRMSTRTIVINRGKVAFHGRPADAIAHYQRLFDDHVQPSRQGLGSVCIHSLRMLDETGHPIRQIVQGQPIAIQFGIRADISIAIVCLDLVFISIADEVVAECNSLVAGNSFGLSAGEDIVVSAQIDSFSLNAGIYRISALVQSADMVTHYDWQKDIASIEVCADRVGVAGQQFRAHWTVYKVPHEGMR
jgi:lipopolysaccharide transport system ATP-binding protein